MIYYVMTAVPERRVWVGQIRNRLPELVVFWDPEGRGSWWNTRRALLSTPTEATHVVVIQDDTFPVRGYQKHIEQIVKLFPGDVISGTSMGWEARDEKARRSGCHFWIRTWGVAGPNLVLPAEAALKLPAWADRRFKFSGRRTDLRIDAYQKEHGLRTIYPVPSLAYHMGARLSVLDKGKSNPNTAMSEVGEVDWAEGMEKAKTYPPGETLTRLLEAFSLENAT